jgi:hypothetical protein
VALQSATKNRKNATKNVTGVKKSDKYNRVAKKYCGTLKSATKNRYI